MSKDPSRARLAVMMSALILTSLVLLLLGVRLLVARHQVSNQGSGLVREQIVTLDPLTSVHLPQFGLPIESVVHTSPPPLWPSLAAWVAALAWLLFLAYSLWRKKRLRAAPLLVMIALVGLFLWTYSRPFMHTLVVYESRSTGYPHATSTQPELYRSTYSDPRLWRVICEDWDGLPPLDHSEFLATLLCRPVSEVAPFLQSEFQVFSSGKVIQTGKGPEGLVLIQRSESTRESHPTTPATAFLLHASPYLAAYAIAQHTGAALTSDQLPVFLRALRADEGLSPTLVSLLEAVVSGE